MNDALDRIIAEIKAELPRSLSLHPPEEWAGKDILAMFTDLSKEVDEISRAYTFRDFHGPHGVYAEINHAIIVLMRMRMELERRENGTNS